nr:unnamed protein product [Digitaria exilis]
MAMEEGSLVYWTTNGLFSVAQGDNEMAIKLLQRIAELKEPEKPINKTCYFQGMYIVQRRPEP